MNPPCFIARLALFALFAGACTGQSVVGGPGDGGPPPCENARGCQGDPAGAVCDTNTGRCVACVTDAHCTGGRVCVANVCVAECAPERPCAAGRSCCAGRCVDVSAEPSSCGACGRSCDVPNAQAACRGGACAVGSCTAPFADCDNAPGNGCETNTQTAAAHCGACGSPCAPRANAAARCEAGQCAYSCAGSFADCDGNPANGCEVNLGSDPTRCGTCTTRCSSANGAPACVMARCAVASCTGTFSDCDADPSNGCETDTASDPARCGSCGNTCAAGANASPTCAAGRCGLACAAGFADCDGDAANGCETDTVTSPAHCGACGRGCSVANGAAACAMSRCAVGSCAAGFADCDGSAANGCETPTRSNNAACGACGMRCGAGQRCEAGLCFTDCRRSGSVECAAGTVCDYTDGACRPTGANCLLTGAFTPCGAQRCGPGSACNPRTMTCVPSLSCAAVDCEMGTDRCWGASCPCSRPPASCATLAPSAVPSAFLSGAFGFDIDDACNMYTATMLSGPDYVRRVNTAGAVTTYTSVANLNMGEVAVQRRVNVGSGPEAVNVAFTYICCAACGCASSPPQGVGHVQSNGTLPVVVPATVSTGTGPFGVNYLDTGPYGLSVSALGEFFVGNVRANGDFVRYDTDTQSITQITTLPRRITASVSFDLDTMLVALEGGALHLVDRAPGGAVSLLGDLGADVQSLRRDAFTGRFYASLRGGRIVSFRPDATGITVETMAARGSRVAVSPDGYLYVLLAEGGPISRVALPTTR